MSMTRDQIVDALAKRLARKEFTVPTVADLRQGGAAMLQDAATVAAIRSSWNNKCQVGEIIANSINTWVRDNRAEAEIETLLSPDDTLSLAEIERLL